MNPAIVWPLCFALLAVGWALLIGLIWMEIQDRHAKRHRGEIGLARKAAERRAQGWK